MGRFNLNPNYARKWPEVRCINDFVAFLGGLTMLIRGLGFLVVTWTTVVLLGGFVSVLPNKDFWSLTMITFIQIVRVVDNSSADKWTSFGASTSGLETVGRVLKRDRSATTSSANIVKVAILLVKQLLGWIAFWVQAGTCIVFLSCSFFVIGFAGPYMATGVALWRLKQHDYGIEGEHSKSNMKPALDALYIIVVVQGAILVYRRVINTLVKKRLVTEVAEEYGFEGPAVALVEDYMKETQRGCAKNPSFAKGRNLVIYAMDLMASPEDYAPGIIILSTTLGPLKGVESTMLQGQCRLIRKLILYAPSSHIFRFLLLLSNPRNRRCGIEMPEATENIETRLIRKHAANIVLHMADGASPELLPQVLHCISSLMGTIEEHQQYFSSYSTDVESDNVKQEYLLRLWECLNVLFVLTADEKNCRLIINTPGLLTKIMTPVASDFYHQTDHNTCEDVLDESMKVMHRLTVAHGQAGAKLFREIETNLQMEAVEMMVRTISFDKCYPWTKGLAMEIFTNLNMPTEIKSREDIIEKLADIYAYTFDSRRQLALEALATLCSQDGNNATIILQVNGSALYSFTDDLDALSDGYSKYNRYYMIVAEILQCACLHYTTDDECLSALKESMTYVIPKVLKKIITAEATPTGQQGSALQDNGQSRSSSSLQEHDNGQNTSSYSPWEIEEQQNIRIAETALLSLCVTVHERFISSDQYLAVQFDEAIDASSLPVKLMEMVERNSDPTPICLKILKLTSRMAVSMMKCRGSRYRKLDLEGLVEALSKACSRKMCFIDSSMDFARGDDAAKTMKPERTFASFVTEAMDLVRDYRA